MREEPPYAYSDESPPDVPMSHTGSTWSHTTRENTTADPSLSVRVSVSSSMCHVPVFGAESPKKESGASVSMLRT